MRHTQGGAVDDQVGGGGGGVQGRAGFQRHCRGRRAGGPRRFRQGFGPAPGAVGNVQPAHAGADESLDHAPRGTAGAQNQNAAPGRFQPAGFAQGAQEPVAVGVVAGEATVAAHDGVDGAGFARPVVNLVQKGHNRLFVGDGHIDAVGAGGGAQAGDEIGHARRGNRIGPVGGGYGQGVQRRLVEPGRYGVGNGPADDAEGGIHAHKPNAVVRPVVN